MVELKNVNFVALDASFEHSTSWNELEGYKVHSFLCSCIYVLLGQINTLHLVGFEEFCFYFL